LVRLLTTGTTPPIIGTIAPITGITVQTIGITVPITGITPPITLVLVMGSLITVAIESAMRFHHPQASSITLITMGIGLVINQAQDRECSSYIANDID